MEADPRTKEVLSLLTQIGEQIDVDAFERARQSLNRLIEWVGDNDSEVTRISTLLDFLEEGK